MLTTRRTHRRRFRATLTGLLALGVIAALGPAAAGAGAAQLTIAVQTDPAGDTTPFAFNIAFAPQPGDDPGTFVPPTGATVTAGSPVTLDVHKGFYTVTQQTPAGYKLVDIVCQATPPDTDPADAFRVDVGLGQARIELSDNENKSCTFVNRKQPVLRIFKYTDPAGAAGSFAFHPGTSLGAPDFSLGDGQSTQFVLDPGTYDVTEQPLAGWTLRSAACDDSDSVVSGATATAVLAAGEFVTCTFTNAPTPAAATPAAAAAVAPAAPAAPAAGVKAVTARRGVAALIAPTRCVSGRYTVAVVGGPVRSVSWYVNGRRIGTTRAHAKQRRFTVVVPAGSHVQKVTARVAFAADASPQSRTLQATVRRCAPTSVQPKFTG